MNGPMSRHHAARVEAAIASGQAARSALVASWRRSSRLHHLDPAGRSAPMRLSDVELRQARERVAPLLAAAQGAMDRLYQAVGASGCCVLLADGAGVPVDRRGTAVDDARRSNPGACGPARSGARSMKAPTASAPASSSSAR
ncbi:transcriptional regulator of acetoin/glycerol metabolism [Bradyrhizobium sp. i1.3.1]